MSNQPETLPPQKQHPDSHGKEHKMEPAPKYDAEWYKGSEKLKDRVAIITGGDSGIGRSVAILFAREGADICIGYFKNKEDAEDTKKMVEKEGRRCITFQGDVSDRKVCQAMVQKTIDEFKKLDILVNNAAVQFVCESVEDISEEQLHNTFKVNIYHMFYMTQEAMKYLEKSDYASIINTASVTAFKGKQTLLDYSSTKGAIVAYTRSLSQNLAEKKIRVNAIAPGPIWTPLIPSSFDSKQVSEFGKGTALGRPGQPEECAPAYVYLASKDSSYVTGQVIHINGGHPV
jgi:NAD(P)-dependent dehydrogenase (short-subunit alcohol dehydrogenase family)